MKHLWRHKIPRNQAVIPSDAGLLLLGWMDESRFLPFDQAPDQALQLDDLGVVKNYAPMGPDTLLMFGRRADGRGLMTYRYGDAAPVDFAPAGFQGRKVFGLIALSPDQFVMISKEEDGSQTLWCFHRDGRTCWRAPLPVGDWWTITPYDGDFLAAHRGKELWLLHAGDGTPANRITLEVKGAIAELMVYRGWCFLRADFTPLQVLDTVTLEAVDQLDLGLTGHLPVFAEDRLYYAVGDHLYCMDVATRREHWRFQVAAKRKTFIQVQVLVQENRVMFGTTEGHLICLDRDTGALVDSVQLDDKITRTPIIHGRRLYVAGWGSELHCFALEGSGAIIGKPDPVRDRGTAVALDGPFEPLAYDGARDWLILHAAPYRNHPAELAVMQAGRIIRRFICHGAYRPVLVDDRVYYTQDSERDNRLSCIDLDTGDIQVATVRDPARDPMYQTAHGRRLYLTHFHQDVQAEGRAGWVAPHVQAVGTGDDLFFTRDLGWKGLSRRELVRVALPRGRETILRADDLEVSTPSLSPDGRLLAYTYGGYDCCNRLVIYDLAKNEQLSTTEIDMEWDDPAPVWLDRDRVLLGSSHGARQDFKIAALGETVTVTDLLGRNGFVDKGFACTPQGLVFRTEAHELTFFPLPGT